MSATYARMSGEEGLSVRASPASSPTHHGMASLGRENQDRSWISMFSRPALSFLQKYLPGLPRNPALSDSGGTGWVSEDFRHNLVDDQRAFLGQLDELMPGAQHSSTPHLSYLHCENSGPAGLIQTTSGDTTLGWITADSLQELGIQTAAEMEMNIRQQTQTGYLAATARSVLSHVFLSSASSTQDITHTEGAGQVLGGRNWYTDEAGSPMKNAGSTKNWWGGFWGNEEGPQSLLSNASWGKEMPLTSKHCSQQEGGTKAAVAKPTELSVQPTNRESMPGESAGQHSDKEQPMDNDSLQTSPPESLQSSERLTIQHQPSITTSGILDTEGTEAACSEVAVLTPDQDNGYSSLEEEHVICQLYMVKAPCEEEPQQATDGTVTDKETEGRSSEAKEEAESLNSREMEEEEEEDDSHISESDEEGERTIQEDPSAAAMPLTPPYCQNKAIAYIMGSPCSDEDDDSQSDSEFDSDDDDGFDSEGSSELSDSVDEEDDEDSDNETSEAARLWNSLCESRDPYNPSNFTASITTPRTIPIPNPPTSSAASPCSPQSSPGSPPNHNPSPPDHNPSPPDHNPSPLSTSPASPPSSWDNDSWDDSTSASEVDEAESLRLWNSFSSFSDPFSPFSFQGPLRTREPRKVGVPGGQGKKVSRTRPRSPCHAAAASAVVQVLQYREEDAEERLDSGFSEPVVSAVAASATATPCFGTIKRVRFSEDIEEFFASCGEEEDRRGPWEELARDRCRFLRRCQEVEQSIAFCLEPQHRSLMYHRFTIYYTQDT